MNKTFAERLKAARLNENLTQGMLATLVGISHGSIVYYEAGIRIPTIETASRLANALHVSLDYLSGHKCFDGGHDFAVLTGLSDKSIARLRQLSDSRNERLLDAINTIIESVQEGQ